MAQTPFTPPPPTVNVSLDCPMCHHVLLKMYNPTTARYEYAHQAASDPGQLSCPNQGLTFTVTGTASISGVTVAAVGAAKKNQS